jgi:hypothetical protein
MNASFTALTVTILVLASGPAAPPHKTLSPQGERGSAQARERFWLYPRGGARIKKGAQPAPCLILAPRDGLESRS